MASQLFERVIRRSSSVILSRLLASLTHPSCPLSAAFCQFRKGRAGQRGCRVRNRPSAAPAAAASQRRPPLRRSRQRSGFGFSAKMLANRGGVVGLGFEAERQVVVAAVAAGLGNSHPSQRRSRTGRAVSVRRSWAPAPARRPGAAGRPGSPRRPSPGARPAPPRGSRCCSRWHRRRADVRPLNARHRSR
jgi:hypothetical protein